MAVNVRTTIAKSSPAGTAIEAWSQDSGSGSGILNRRIFVMGMPLHWFQVTSSPPYGTFRLSNLYPGLTSWVSSVADLSKLDLKNASVQQPPFPCNDPLLFVIPSAPGFPASSLSPATTYVVLPKENHMQLTEAATLDRKSGEAEGSAVRHSCAPLLPAQTSTNHHRILMETLLNLAQDCVLD
jgi:hypothetical protein